MKALSLIMMNCLCKIITVLIIAILLVPSSPTSSKISSMVTAEEVLDCATTKQFYLSDRTIVDTIRILPGSNCNVTLINIRAIRVVVSHPFGAGGSNLTIRGLTCTTQVLQWCIEFTSAISGANYVDIEDVRHTQVMSSGTQNNNPAVVYVKGIIQGVTGFVRFANIRLTGRCQTTQCAAMGLRFGGMISTVAKLIVQDVAIEQYTSIESTQADTETKFRAVVFEQAVNTVSDILIEDVLISSMNFLAHQFAGTLRVVDFANDVSNGQPGDDHSNSKFIIRNITITSISFSGNFSPATMSTHTIEAVYINSFKYYETVSISNINVHDINATVEENMHFEVRAVRLFAESVASPDAAVAAASSFTVSDVSISNVNMLDGKDGPVTVHGMYMENALTGYYKMNLQSFRLSNINLRTNTSTTSAHATVIAIALKTGLFTPKHHSAAAGAALPSAATNFTIDDLALYQISLVAYQNILKGMDINGAEVREYEVLSFTNFRLNEVSLGVDESGAFVSPSFSSSYLLECKKVKGWETASTSSVQHQLIIANFSQQNIVAKTIDVSVIIRNLFYALDGTSEQFKNFNSIIFENHLLQNISAFTNTTDSTYNVFVDCANIEQPILPDSFSSATNASVIFRNIIIDQLNCKILEGSLGGCFTHAVIVRKRVFGLQQLTLADLTISNLVYDVPSATANFPFVLNAILKGIQASSQTAANTFNENTTVVVNNLRQTNIKISSNAGAIISGFRVDGMKVVADFATIKLTNFLFEDISVNNDESDRRTASGRGVFVAPIFMYQITAAGDQEATTARSIEVDGIIVRRAQLFAAGAQPVALILVEVANPTLRYTRISFKNMIIEDTIRCGFADNDTVGTGDVVLVVHMRIHTKPTMSTLDAATLELLSQNEETRPGFFCDNFLISDVEAHSISTTRSTHVHSAYLIEGLENFAAVEFTNLRMENIYVTSRRNNLPAPTGSPPYPKGVFVAHVAVETANELIELTAAVPSANGFVLRNLTLDTIHGVQLGEAQGVIAGFIGSSAGVSGAYNVILDRIHFTNINASMTNDQNSFNIIAVWMLDGGFSGPTSNIIAPTTFLARDFVFRNINSHAAKASSILMFHIWKGIDNFVNVTLTKWRLENIYSIAPETIDVNALGVTAIRMDSDLLRPPQMIADSVEFELKVEDFVMKDVRMIGGSGSSSAALFRLHNTNGAKIDGYAFVNFTSFLMDNITMLNRGSAGTHYTRLNVFFFNNNANPPSVSGHAYSTASSLPASFYSVNNITVKNVFMENSNYPVSLFVYESWGIDGGFSKVEFDRLYLEDTSIHSMDQAQAGGIQVALVQVIGTTISSISLDSTRLACERKFSVTNSFIDNISLIQVNPSAHPIQLSALHLPGDLTNAAAVEINQVAITNIIILNASTNAGLKISIFEQQGTTGISAESVYSKTVVDSNTRCAITQFIAENLDISNIAAEEGAAATMTSWKLQMVSLVGELIDYSRVRIENNKVNNIAAHFQTDTGGSDKNLELILFDFAENIEMSRAVAADSANDIRHFTVRSCFITDIDVTGVTTGIVGCFRLDDAGTIDEYTMVLFQSFDLRRIKFETVSMSAEIVALKIGGEVTANIIDSNLPGSSSSFFTVSDINIEDITAANSNNISSVDVTNQHQIKIYGFYQSASVESFYNFTVQNILLRNCYASGGATRARLIAYQLVTADNSELDAVDDPIAPPTLTVQHIRISNCTALSAATSSSFVGVRLHAVFLSSTAIGKFVVINFNDIVINEKSRVESHNSLFVASLFISKDITSNVDLRDESSLSFENIHISDIAAHCPGQCTEFEVRAVSLLDATISAFNYLAVQHISISDCDIVSTSTSLDVPLSVSLFYADTSEIRGWSSSSPPTTTTSPVSNITTTPAISLPRHYSRRSLLLVSDLVMLNVKVHSAQFAVIESIVFIRRDVQTFSQLIFENFVTRHVTLQISGRTRLVPVVMGNDPVDIENLLVSNCSISHVNMLSSANNVIIKIFDAAVSYSGEVVFDALNMEHLFVRTSSLDTNEDQQQTVDLKSIHLTAKDIPNLVPFSSLAVSNCFISKVTAYSTDSVHAILFDVDEHPLAGRADINDPSVESVVLFENLKIEHVHLQSEASNNNNKTNTISKDGSDFVSVIFQSSSPLQHFSKFTARDLRQSNITIVSMTYSNSILAALLYSRAAGFATEGSLTFEDFKMNNINFFTSAATASNRPSSVNVSFATIRVLAAKHLNMSNMNVDLSNVLSMKEETGKTTQIPSFTFLEFLDRDTQQSLPTPLPSISVTLENNIIRATNIPSSSSSLATFFRLSTSWMPPFSNLSFIHNDILLPKNKAVPAGRKLQPFTFFEFTPFNQITPPSSPAIIVFENNSLVAASSFQILSTSSFVEQSPTKLADIIFGCDNRWIRGFENGAKQRFSSLPVFEFPDVCPGTDSMSASFSTSYSHNTSEVTPPRTFSPSREDTVSNNTPSHTESNPTQTFTPVIPPRKKVGEAIPPAAKAVGNAISALAGPMGAMTTRKIMAIAAMADCGKDEITDEQIPDVDAVDTNPMRIKFGSRRFNSHRGAIFGSVIFCIAWLLMMVLLAYLRSRVDKDCSMSRAMRKIGVPGTIAVPAFSLFPVAVNSGAKIAKRYYPDEKFDIFVLIFCATMTIIVPIIALIWVCYEVKDHEVLKLPNTEENNNNEDDVDGSNDVNNSSKPKTMTEAEKEAKEIDDFVNDAITEKPPKWKIYLDYLTEPTVQYKKSRFADKYGAIYDNAISPIFVLLLFIFTIMGEIGEGYASLCDRSDYTCCQSGVLVIAIASMLDLLLIVVFFVVYKFHSPFLVRLERWFFPLVSIIGVVNTTLVVLSFFTGTRDSDGVNSVDFTDVLTITTEAGFYIAVIVTLFAVANEVFSGATYEFYSAWKVRRDVKKYEAEARIGMMELEEELDEMLLATPSTRNAKKQRKHQDENKERSDANNKADKKKPSAAAAAADDGRSDKKKKKERIKIEPSSSSNEEKLNALLTGHGHEQSKSKTEDRSKNNIRVSSKGDGVRDSHDNNKKKDHSHHHRSSHRHRDKETSRSLESKQHNSVKTDRVRSSEKKPSSLSRREYVDL